jgi:hypothetical protein
LPLDREIAAVLRAALYLYFDCWDEAHEIAQDINTPEGSYWHGIVHRQEPDAANAAYWFRQVGAHPIFPALRERAVEIGLATGAVSPPQFAVPIMGESTAQLRHPPETRA